MVWVSPYGTMWIVLGVEDPSSATGTFEESEGEKCLIRSGRDMRPGAKLSNGCGILVVALPIGGNGRLVKGKLSFLWSLPRFDM